MHPEAPTAAELEANSVVRAALAAAWTDSQADDPPNRHEEGGWIYQNLTTNEIEVRRAARGRQAAINLADPPELDGFVVVGKFHTHPNPTAEGWNPGPSASDLRIDAIHGVPDLIQADDGVYHSGPDRRRGGLMGNAGYPA
jgi:hypothetical protein